MYLRYIIFKLCTYVKTSRYYLVHLFICMVRPESRSARAAARLALLNTLSIAMSSQLFLYIYPYPDTCWCLLVCYILFRGIVIVSVPGAIPPIVDQS